MAINTVVTRGYGNGTFSGTISLVVTRGYAIGAAAPSARPSDGGGGRPEPRRVIDPREVYGRRKETEETRTKLAETIQRYRKRAKALPKEHLPDEDLKAVRRDLAGLARSATALERRIEQARTEKAIETITARYRELVAKEQALARELARLEELAAHHARLLREDQEFLYLLQYML